MISAEGIPFIGGGVALTVIFGIFFGLAGSLPCLGLTLFIVYFFRDPRRRPVGDEKTVVSPADGKVIEIVDLHEGEFLKQDVKRISIFLSIFNVHVNRAPYAGVVKKIDYRPGRFPMAFSPKASDEAEQNRIVLSCENGIEILFCQIAGFIARRIVCRIKEGEEVQRGAKIGMIRFGSRLDLYLPISCELQVSVGDRVSGGETPIGRFQ